MRSCRDFHALLPRLLKADGIYSYFNGLAADNAFFHMVYCNIAAAELQQLGLETEFVPLPIDCSNPKVWEGVRCDATSSLQPCFPVVRNREGLSYCCLHRQWCSTGHPLVPTHAGTHCALCQGSILGVQEPLLAAGHLHAPCLHLDSHCWRQQSSCS